MPRPDPDRLRHDLAAGLYRGAWAAEADSPGHSKLSFLLMEMSAQAKNPRTPERTELWNKVALAFHGGDEQASYTGEVPAVEGT